VCALVAILNAVCWALITPPFQVPDEPSHFAYVKQLVENHALPTASAQEFSHEEDILLVLLREQPYMPATGTISTRSQHERLEHALDEAAEETREGSPDAGVATSQPPLYYALESIPYLVGYDGNLLTRLTLMRLFSALFAGLTALFVYLFVRECLPATPFAAVAAGLGIALAPLLGFMSGSVNPDSLLFAVSAALFWSLARAFRRGLTYRRAALIGGIIAVGALTKLNFVGLFPGAILGLAVLALRERRSSRERAYRTFGLGVGIAVLPIAVIVLLELARGRPAIGPVSAGIGEIHSPFKDAEFVWKFFLPRLPFMKPYVPGLFTTQQIWFNGFVGQYGWVETAFPEWVYTIALAFGSLLLLAFVLALVAERSALRRRLAELGVYAVIALGLVTLIGSVSFYHRGGGESYTQARYLLPLLALFAAGLGLATRALGRRWSAVIGTLVVLLMLADNIFSQLLVIARFYG
jgi:4-amino-4-deoxy-L-arabinose transferase-like glycosyltransferase